MNVVTLCKSFFSTEEDWCELMIDWSKICINKFKFIRNPQFYHLKIIFAWPNFATYEINEIWYYKAKLTLPYSVCNKE